MRIGVHLYSYCRGRKKVVVVNGRDWTGLDWTRVESGRLVAFARDREQEKVW